MWKSPLVLVLAGLCVDTCATAQTPAVTKFLHTFAQLRAAFQSPRRIPVKGQFSDAEINQYMQYSLAATRRPGLDSITIKIFPQNYFSTFTVVDFDAVERWKPGTIPLLLKPVLHGRKSVWIDVRIKVQDAQATFSVEKARYNDIWLPAFFVEKMIHIVAARQPEKYDTSKPVPLPFGLRRIWTVEHVAGFEN
jgi:hypothetical protein